jgi:hypothetical protein
MKHLLHVGVSWAGLAVAPAAWALSTQGNYTLANWTCGRWPNLVVFVALALALSALIGGVLSWRAWRSSGAGAEILLHADDRPHAFLALLSAGLALLFAAVILMQAVAGLVLSGCER